MDFRRSIGALRPHIALHGSGSWVWDEVLLPNEDGQWPAQTCANHAVPGCEDLTALIGCDGGGSALAGSMTLACWPLCTRLRRRSRGCRLTGSMRGIAALTTAGEGGGSGGETAVAVADICSAQCNGCSCQDIWDPRLAQSVRMQQRLAAECRVLAAAFMLPPDARVRDCWSHCNQFS